MVTEAFPLQWPAGWHREPEPQHSRFGEWNKKPSIYAATEKIIYEMRLFGGQDLIVSTNLKLKKDGLPYSGQKEPQDRGVAVYFFYDGAQKVIACDSFDKIGCNLWAIGKTIEAMRGIDRWGCSQIITKAFTGFVALAEVTQETWWQVLGVAENAKNDEVKTAFREKSKFYHPDINGGDDTHFKKINEAFQKYKNLQVN